MEDVGKRKRGRPKKFAAEEPKKKIPAEMVHVVTAYANRRVENGKDTNSAGNAYKGNPAAVGQRISASKNYAAANGVFAGNDLSFYNLMDDIAEDPAVAACLDLRAAYLLMRPRLISFKDGEEQYPQAEEILEFLRKYFYNTAEFSAFVWSHAFGATVHGRATSEIMYEYLRSISKIVPAKILHIHPGAFQFDLTGSGRVQTASGGNVTYQPIPPKKFISTIRTGLYSTPYGRSELKALAHFWNFKKIAVANYVQMTGKSGTSVLHGKLDTEVAADNIDALKTALADAMEAVEGGGAEYIVTAAGETLEYLNRGQAAASGAEFYAYLIKYADRLISLVLLGSELVNQTATNGNRALGEVHERATLNKVMPIAEPLARAINEAAAWFVELNFGSAAPVPVFEFDTEEKTDAEQARKTFETALNLGIEIAVSEVREKLGLKAPEPGEDVIGKSPESAEQKTAAISPQSENEDPEESKNSAEDADVSRFSEISVLAAQEFAADPRKLLNRELWKDTTGAGIAFRQEFIQRAKRRAARMSLIQDKAANAFLDAFKSNVRTVVLKTRDNIAKVYADAPDANLDYFTARRCIDPAAVWSQSEKTSKILVYACAFLAMASSAQSLADVAEEVKENGGSAAFSDDEGFLKLLPEDFQAAVSWMLARKVMGIEEVKSFARYIGDFLGVSYSDVESGLRSEILALAGAVDVKATERVQKWIADAVANGSSAGEFLDKLDSVLGIDPEGADDAYWHNVFRTEISNAYDVQQREQEATARFQSNLWGHEVYNPRDSRSRKTHAALSGKLFRKGSDAHALLGRTPFAYQCRCVMLAIMVPGGESSAYNEADNAVQLAAQVQRF